MRDGSTDSIEQYVFVELNLYGDIEGEVVGEDPPIHQPQSVTVPAPKASDHVAIIRTPPEVTFLAVSAWDDLGSFDSDFETPAVVDGETRSEFWIDADALTTAELLHINTRGPDLEDLDLDIEYRGWKARLKKRIREWKQKRRAKRAVQQGRQ